MPSPLHSTQKFLVTQNPQAMFVTKVSQLSLFIYRMNLLWIVIVADNCLNLLKPDTTFKCVAIGVSLLLVRMILKNNLQRIKHCIQNII